MYSKEFEKSLKAVEAAREDNIALEPRRMTADEKDALLAAYHPDYKKSEFSTLKIGPNKGEQVPHELCEMLEAHSRIKADDVDLSNVTYDVDVLIIGGGGAGASAAIEADMLGQQGISLILIGGEIRHDVRACSGYLAKDMLSNMVFDKGFLGIEHISFSHGLTTPNMNDAEMKRWILRTCKQSYVLADYSKFWNDSLIQIAPADRVYRIITDWHIAEDDISRFQAKGVSLVSAPAVSNL